jgi:methionine synthase I (cobalamin-dependent)/5,10-methylenetetrahydrofolate reductase
MAISFRDRLQQGPILGDGAMGTQLYARGVDVRPLDRANLTAPHVVKAIHLDYLQAGSEVIQSNTFGANAVRLAAEGVGAELEAVNRAGVRLAKEARMLSGQPIWIAGAMGPLGIEGAPIGAFDAGLAHNVFAEQAAILADEGVDLFALQTFTALYELKIAIEAVGSVSNLPIVAEMTFTQEGMTPAGDTPEEIARALQDMNVVAFGGNCSVGPEVLTQVVERMAAIVDIPLTAEANAGLPEYVNGKLAYAAGPKYFAESARQIVEIGAVLIGGCCGTTPEHIAYVRDSIRGVNPSRQYRHPESRPAQVVTRTPIAAKPDLTGLASKLAAGEFVVTTELSPPRGFDITDTLEKLRPVAAYLTAVNVADSPRAQGRMSALATCSLIQSRLGIETIMHQAIRHRNLLALHSDLLGAHALGVRNVFTVMGDPPLSGDYPEATAIADVTASGLIKLISGFNQGFDGGERPIEQPTSFLIGAAFNLTSHNLDRELRVLDRKVESGADFLLTQPAYDPEAVERVAARLGGFPRPLILAVLPLRSVRHARFLHNEVPGISIPDSIMERMERAGDGAAAEGIAISQELIRATRSRIAGVYFIPPFDRFQVIAETLDGLDIAASVA